MAMIKFQRPYTDPKRGQGTGNQDLPTPWKLTITIDFHRNKQKDTLAKIEPPGKFTIPLELTTGILSLLCKIS